MSSSSSSSFSTTSNHLISTTIFSPRHRSHNHPPPLLLNFHRLSSSYNSHSSASNSTLLKTLALSSAVKHFLTGGNAGGGGGGGGGGAWFGGSGEGSFFWSRLFTPLPSIADDNNNKSSQSQEFDSHGLPANITLRINRLSGSKKYKISEISLFDRVRKANVGSDDPFFEMLTLRAGDVYTKAQLQKKLDYLANCAVFKKVDMLATTNPDGTINIAISFVENTWRSNEKFRCINVSLLPKTEEIGLDPDATDKELFRWSQERKKELKSRIERSKPCILPMSVHREITDMLREQGSDSVGIRFFWKIRDRVMKWYRDQGFTCARFVNCRNLDRELVFEVAEGDISQMYIQFLDYFGNVVEGKTQIPVIQRELPFPLRPGYPLDFGAMKQALRNIDFLDLFSKIQLKPKYDEKTEGGIILEINLRELEKDTVAEFNTEWNFVPGQGGLPTLVSLQPGGSVIFKHGNLQGLKRTITGLISTCNFFNPEDDLAFKFEYTQPYFDGVHDPSNRILRVSCFTGRKKGPVFTGGPDMDHVLEMWVDRTGVKANITKNFTSQSKFTYGLVMEEIKTLDDEGDICTHGRRMLANGDIFDKGPPTTLSGTGIDRMAFLQANITRDNTKFVNGAVVGERNVFQVDQGLGIGSNYPFFNRHQLTLTRFLQLMPVEEGARKPPPPVLVLHCHYGGCIGDLPSYDAFILGGPFSVRGYRMGEIGVARKILELAAELRIPIKGKHVYVFAEHGNDLGSSKDVKGNPTEAYGRRGHGSSYGAGVKLGLVRVEYAVEHNTGTGAIFVRFGERF
ncbi:hypothetical protein RIF29_32077 [Crotalaria pallida]|uniref:Bacterial surface antigen (D15) domain-containing protein n=1 Tax=Crotalaria pallida TaxID=3830 RepID=A0AAN9EIK0_CROPI